MFLLPLKANMKKRGCTFFELHHGVIPENKDQVYIMVFL
tara:strand:+ start:2497 stop:2613 length:117 start_codon:yes stop_codon:yes gene_type:complete